MFWVIYSPFALFYWPSYFSSFIIQAKKDIAYDLFHFFYDFHDVSYKSSFICVVPVVLKKNIYFKKKYTNNQC